jgi:hypothetical protein
MSKLHDNTVTQGIHPLACLLRGFAVDFITGHNLDVVERIMAPEYCLSIGGYLLNGRDTEYLPPTAAQINQFPGLTVTVHDVVYGENTIAMQFTEHGRSRADQNRGATWRGITLFRTDGERLRWGWAEEDYFARKRQLSSGTCDHVDAPHAAPWDVQPGVASSALEVQARAWLDTPSSLFQREDAFWLSSVSDNDPHPQTLIDIDYVEVDELFTADDRVAFHALYHGHYKGGFKDVDKELIGRPIVLRAAGILTFNSTELLTAAVTVDRLRLYRSLRFN